jgi:hypothetical protein
MSKAEQMLLEEKLKREDPNSYDLLLQIRANCKKGRANMKYAATIPLDEVNSEADLAPGDKVDGSASAALVGSNCPLDYGGGIGMNAEVTGKDESSVSGNGGYNVKFNGVMKDGKYANLLGARGLLLDAGISAMAVRRDVVANKNDRILADFKMTGTFLSIKNSIPFSADVKALISNTLKDDKVSNASLEIIADLKIQMPNFSANLVIHQKQKDNVVTEALSSFKVLEISAFTSAENGILFFMLKKVPVILKSASIRSFLLATTSRLTAIAEIPASKRRPRAPKRLAYFPSFITPLNLTLYPPFPETDDSSLPVTSAFIPIPPP